MTTTLYIITLSAWHVFSIFEEPDQILRFTEIKAHVERVLEVEATCLSRMKDGNILLDDQLYQRGNA